MEIDLRHPTREEYLAVVNRLRFGYSDEIPVEIIHSSIVRYGKIVAQEYKCRKGWFQSIYVIIEQGRDCKFISHKVSDSLKRFMQYSEKTNLKKRLTVRKDISRGDKLLDLIIEELKSK